MFCKKCGNELKQGADFCGKCGTPINNLQSATNNQVEINKKEGIISAIIFVFIICMIVFIISNWESIKTTGIGTEMQEETTIGKRYTKEEIDNMIGKYVDYQPTHRTYIAKSSATDARGILGEEAKDQEFETQDMKWRIWNVDNKNIMLISDEPTSYGENRRYEYLNLYGKKAYENGIEVLDELCKKCYTNPKYKGISVRSLNLQDIESVIDEKELNIKEYKENIIKEIEAKLTGEPLKAENLKINAWCVNNEADAITMESSYYRKPVYAEMIHSGKIPYYLATKMEMTCLATVESTKGNLESLGLYCVGSSTLERINEKVITPLISYSKFDGQEGENEYSRSVRPVVIIPLSSCEIVNDTEGTRGDMWSIIAK